MHTAIKQSLFALVLMIATSISAQENGVSATTDDGRKVTIYPDGTWRLIKPTAAIPSPGKLPANGAPNYVKPVASKVYAKAKRSSFGVWVNEDKWKEDPSESDPNKKTFNHAAGDGYAMVISERISIPTDKLKVIAIGNAKGQDPNARVVSEEKRTVNGKEILCMKIAGTIEGVPFIYFGYYYGGPEGALQVVTYTSANLFDEFKQDFEDFLNGTQIGQQ